MAFDEVKSADVANRIGVVGIDFERAHESSIGLLTIAEPDQHECELVVEPAVVRLAGDGLS
jgi:hypothetical protein